jgi:hypothetical protein
MVIYMLHMVIILLKIIGILLCVILGLLLSILLVVLLVPIRYGLWADNREDIQGRVRVTWLLRIISFHITYVNEKLSIKLKIFGRIFYDKNNPRSTNKGKGPKSNRKAKQNKDRKLKKQTSNSKSIKSESIIDNITNNSLNKEFREQDNKELDNKPIDNKGSVNPQEAKRPAIDIKENEDKSDQFSNENNLKNPAVNVLVDSKIQEEFTETINEEEFKFVGKIKVFFKKIKDILAKVKGFFQKIKLGLQKVKSVFQNIGKKISDLIGKWEKIKAFYNVEANKQGIKLSFLAIKKVLKHILPRKIKGELEFGTGDPSSTGQALGIAACFYCIYGKSIHIIPNFNEEILKGNIYITGRIRIVTLLIIVVKLIINKNFKKLIKNFRAFKEDL